MTHETILERLDDYVSGELAPRDERDVRRHLMGCDACRAEEQALRTLLDEAAALPAAVAPPRDLWAGIAARLEPRAAPSLGDDDDDAGEADVVPLRRARPRALPWWMQAAAAVALVVTTSVGTLLWSGRGGEDDRPVAQAPAPAPARDAALVAFRPAEREYQTAIGELQAALDQKRAVLAPETVATLERNLAIIDRAIAESRAALEADPARPELARLLADAYGAKVGALRQAVSM